jgi:hypothetical protein
MVDNGLPVGYFLSVAVSNLQFGVIDLNLISLFNAKFFHSIMMNPYQIFLCGVAQFVFTH